MKRASVHQLRNKISGRLTTFFLARHDVVEQHRFNDVDVETGVVLSIASVAKGQSP